MCLPAAVPGQSQCLLWPQAFHMQLPMDIAEPDCYLVVSFEKKQYGQVEMLSWCKIALEVSSMDSAVASANMNPGDGVEAGQVGEPFQRMDYEMIVTKRAIISFN